MPDRALWELGYAAEARRSLLDTRTSGATADVLARSAQHGPGEPTPEREAVRDFRGVAAIVAQTQLSRDSPMAWAMLINRLGRTLRTIGDAHAARGETEMAKLLVDKLSAEIASLHDRFETNSRQELVPGEHAHEVRSLAEAGRDLQH